MVISDLGRTRPGVKRYRASRSGQAGFTLIEVIMTLAISGFLVVIAFTGQAEIRRRAQFSDAIERIKNNLGSVRAEALGTVICRNGVDCGLTNGGDNNRQVSAKEVIFYPGAGTDHMQVSSLIGSTTNFSTPYTRADTHDLDYAWQAFFNPPSNNAVAVVFWRSPIDGSMRTSVFNCSDSTCSTNATLNPNAAEYGVTSGNKSLIFSDPNSYNGSVLIDFPSGSITRQISQ